MPSHLWYTLLALGLVIRIYLILTLPVWHDEAYSIWASEHSLLSIITAAVDPVHPPGYYLLLKFISTISDHLVWLRLSTLGFFLINLYLINRIGNEISKKNGQFFSTVYALSGYFVIFDWQVRMYTLVITLILASLYLYISYLKGSRINIPVFTIINLLGLYIDYVFVWYLFPLLCFAILSWARNTSKSLIILLSLVTSSSGFLLIFPWVFSNFIAGLNGVNWTQQFSSPAFVLSYLMGSHYNIFVTILLVLLVLFGIISSVKKQVWLARELLFTILLSVGISYGYSFFFKPLVHVRSLQIVALSFAFFVSVALTRVFERWRVFTYCFFYLLVINLLVVSFSLGPSYLIDFLGWKNVVAKLGALEGKQLLYRQISRPPTPLLEWGLEYTLSGKESLFMRSVNHRKLAASEDVDSVCARQIVDWFEIYLCSQEFTLP